MQDIFQKIKKVLNKDQKISLVYIFFLILIGVFLEVLGIGMIIPLMNVLVNNDIATDFPKFKPVLEALGNPSKENLILYSLLLLLIIYALKNLFLAYLTWKKSNLVRISEEILQSERGVNSNDTSNTREKVILLCVIENPRLLNDFFEELGQLNFNKTDFLRLCSFIVEYASNDDKELEKEALKSYLNNSEFSNIVGEIYKDELLRTYRTLIESDYETLKFTFLELLNLQNKFTANTQLEDAEALLAENMDDASFEKFLKLKKDSLTKES